jgi:hypothetical protein
MESPRKGDRDLVPVLVGTVGAAVAGVLIGALTRESLLGLFAALATVGLAVLLRMVGVRGVAVGFLLFVIPPAVLGEASSVTAGVAVVAIGAIALTYPPAPRNDQPGVSTLLVLAVVGPAVSMLITGVLGFALLYVFVAVIVSLAASRPAFVKDMLRGLTSILLLLSVSYAVTLAVGFANLPMSSLTIRSRALELYPPFTLASGGAPLIEGSRRFAPLVGEPGLTVFFVVPLLALLLTRDISRRDRWVVLVTVLAVTVFGQSLASDIAIGAALGVAGLLLLLRERKYVTAIVYTVAVAVIAPSLLQNQLDWKAINDPASLTDRAVLNAGDATAASNGAINILVSLRLNAPPAVCLLLGLVFALLVARRSIGGFASWIAFAVVAFFAQPSQWEIGAWLLLSVGLLPTNARQPDDEIAIARQTRRRLLPTPRLMPASGSLSGPQPGGVTWPQASGHGVIVCGTQSRVLIS